MGNDFTGDFWISWGIFGYHGGFLEPWERRARKGHCSPTAHPQAQPQPPATSGPDPPGTESFRARGPSRGGLCPYLPLAVRLHQLAERRVPLDLELHHGAVLPGHLQVDVVVLRFHPFLWGDNAVRTPRGGDPEGERRGPEVPGAGRGRAAAAAERARPPVPGVEAPGAGPRLTLGFSSDMAAGPGGRNGPCRAEAGTR